MRTPFEQLHDRVTVGSTVEHILDRTYIGKVTGIYDDVYQVLWNHIATEQSCERAELVLIAQLPPVYLSRMIEVTA